MTNLEDAKRGFFTTSGLDKIQIAELMTARKIDDVSVRLQLYYIRWQWIEDLVKREREEIIKLYEDREGYEKLTGAKAYILSRGAIVDLLDEAWEDGRALGKTGGKVGRKFGEILDDLTIFLDKLRS